MTGRATQWGDLVVASEARRHEIRRRHSNGLDTIEVDHGGHRLVLTFLEHAPREVGPANIRIEGPPRAAPVRALRVGRATEADPHLEDRLLVELAGRGGPGRYTLALVERRSDGLPGRAPLRGLDPRFTRAAFTFDVDLPNPVAGAPAGAAAGLADRQASYLARDYEGLRQLILDRLAQTMPAWTERHIPDIGITLVELLAYVGDDLSYYQDAIATEAYLPTSRRRISVRRHARLVDYRLGEGCQARAWVCVAVSDTAELPLRELVFVATPSLPPEAPPVLSVDALGVTAGYRPYTPVRASLGPPAPMGADTRGRGPTVTATPAHNAVALWAWGEPNSWLRAGATSAALVDSWRDPAVHGAGAPRSLNLCPGDVVVFEATVDRSGIGPPDPRHRHPVRLSAVRPSVDRLYDQPICEIRWDRADALPFDLQVTAPGPSGGAVACSVVRANTVLVGDGVGVSETLAPGQVVLTHPHVAWATRYPDSEDVGRHQANRLHRLPEQWRDMVEGWRRDAEDGEPLNEDRLDHLRRLLGQVTVTEFGLGPRHEGERDERDAAGLHRLLLDADRLLAPRVRRLRILAALALASWPLPAVLIREVADDWGAELAGALDSHQPAGWGPAITATAGDARRALPLVSLAPVAAADRAGAEWRVVADVVDGPPGGRQVMVEVDDLGRAHLRFSLGDQPDGPVEAHYQVGQGVAGNLPAEAINAVVALTPGAHAAASAIQRVGNPLPVAGGADPETIVAAKEALPRGFLVAQPRAVVADDYTALAARVPGVGRAATALRGTGTGYAADIAIQPSVGEDPDQELLAAVAGALEPLRRLGHDVWVRPPSYRPLVIGLNVDVGPDMVRAEVTSEVAAVLSSGWQTDGTPGLFNPRRMGFGEAVFASAVVAAVQDIAGVEAVELTRLGFLRPPGATVPPQPPQYLRLRPSEIARLDNDPDAPEHGYTIINLQGGR